MAGERAEQHAQTFICQLGKAATRPASKNPGLRPWTPYLDLVPCSSVDDYSQYIL